MAKQFINNKTSVILIANVILLSVLTCVWLTSKENKNRFQILAHTDSLTNIYNRYGFDELAAKMIAKNPKTHFVAALLILMTLSLSMISMDTVMVTRH